MASDSSGAPADIRADLCHVTTFGEKSILAVCLLFAACTSPPPAPIGATSLQAGVFVQPIAPGVWRHVSYRHFADSGQVPSNGLVVAGAEGAIIVDTAWDVEQTAGILDWVEANVGPARALLVTHAHDDRMGGVAEADRRHIPSYALSETVRRGREQGRPPIRHAVRSPFRLEALGVSGELYFPGPGHTADNATVWLQETRVLAGGCLVRAAAASSMGNTSDGDLEAWPVAIAALQERYPEVRIVVPGHGEPGGPELLTHTRDLLER